MRNVFQLFEGTFFTFSFPLLLFF